MAPPKRPWFRLYTETIWDRKIRRLTPPQRWLWVAVLALARQSPLPGFLVLSTDPLQVLSSHDIADAAALKEAEVTKGLERFVGLGLIVQNPELGAWEIARWNDRQYESDETTKRTAKHRQRNGDGTSKERSNDGDVTPPETETDTEAESEKAHEPAQAAGFDAFWDSYPSRRGTKGSRKNALALWKKLPIPKREAAVNALPQYTRTAGELPKDAERYLRHEAWEGLTTNGAIPSSHYEIRKTVTQ